MKYTIFSITLLVLVVVSMVYAKIAPENALIDHFFHFHVDQGDILADEQRRENLAKEEALKRFQDDGIKREWVDDLKSWDRDERSGPDKDWFGTPDRDR